jgi:hypothetical protein
MKANPRALGLPGLLLLLGAVTLGGCGGGGGSQVAVETAKPPLDFSFRPDADVYHYRVEIGTETEARGASFQQGLNYEWAADKWQRDEATGNWTAQVTFSKINAFTRAPGAVSMEPIAMFKRLEGFSIRFVLDAKGFKPASDPGKDSEFMEVLRQLRTGMSPLDFPRDQGPKQVGETWLVPIDKADMGPLGAGLLDSTLTARYAGDEAFQSRDCARIEVTGKVRFNASLPREDGTLQLLGDFQPQGSSLLDKDRGLIVKDVTRIKMTMQQRMLDADGKPKSAEQNMAQTISISVALLGS